MKKLTKTILTLCLMFAGIGSAFALDDVTLNPTFDCNYRPKADKTGWDSSTPKMANVEGNTNLELRWSSCLFSILEFEVPNFDKAGTIALKLKKSASTNNTTLGIWYYKYMDELPTSTAVTPAYNNFAENVTGAVGTALGSTEGSNEPLAQATVADGAYVLAIHEEGIAAIKTAGVTYKADKTTAIIRLLVSTVVSQGTNTKYISSNSANAEADRPSLTVSYSATVYPVMNITTGQGYDDLINAISAADDGHVIEVGVDQSIGSRVGFDNINGKSLTIQAASGKEVVIKKANGDNITFLTKGNITVKSGEGKIILDGAGISTSKNFWEVGNGNLTLDGVTIRNCVNTSTTSGVIKVNSNRRMYLNNVTFEKNTIAEGGSVIYMRNEGETKGAHLSISGNNTSDVTMIGFESALMPAPIDVSGEITNTEPITIKFVTNPASGYSLVKNYTDASKFALVTPDYRLVSDGTNLIIAENPSFNLNVTDLGWASMYLDFAATVPTGATAYYASSATASSIALTAIEAGSVIPANTGVIVKAAEGVHTFRISAETPVEVTNNLFEGVTVDTSCEANPVYVLSGESTTEKPIFGLYTGTTLGAYKAYLPLDKVPTSAKETVEFTFEGTPTGIEEVESSMFKTQGSAYNLNGVRVNDNYKGVVIKNGKTYINK